MTRPERLAITHYHLRPGGVTRVISHAAEAMSRRGTRVVLLTGRALEPDQRLGAEVRVIEGLDYDTATPDQASRVAAAMTEAAEEALGGEPDLWHAHNHSLGKNSVYPAALRHLADSGHRLLLQIHDFAEDGRPALYRRLSEAFDDDDAVFGRACYPLADHVHYAVLNSRDRRMLLQAGLEPDRLHLIPNAVELKTSHEPVGVDPELLIYPTRAIRRKNIGEFLFWSALAEEGRRFAITLAPNNPLEQPRYRQWVEFAQEKQLPVEFEAGSFADRSFAELLASAAALVTTSVAEGFGLAFLEPYLVGRPVVGRNLTQITEDFSRHRIDLSSLYERLEVPLAWVGAEEVERRIESAIKKTFSAYRRPCDRQAIERAMGASIRDGCVEFGHLDESLQRRAIETVLQNPAEAGSVTPQSLCPAGYDDPAVLENNRRVVCEQYGLSQYGDRLEQAYAAIGDPGRIDPEAHLGRRVLDTFLNPEHFLLLRT
ncbi:MAG: glycosyltransferase [Phycisphaeraceae bacterium]|nr:glycosyltransferase [Phycisphaeraceae bacterium]